MSAATKLGPLAGNRRRVVILGATGSVGQSAAKVARHYPDRLEVVGLAAQRDAAGLTALGRELGVERLVLADPEAAAASGLAGGRQALLDLAGDPGADCVLNAIVGASGLEPSLQVVEAGTVLALANKESMVIGGELLTRRAAATGATIVPVDSEHSAAMQLLEPICDRTQVKRLVLTASGGPFRGATAPELRQVEIDEVLDHPTWSMGPRITVDSATLLNKGFEVIEAHWLFGLPLEQIDVVVHPQSVVHAMVELVDGTLLANLSPPDMRLPVQLALGWPERWPKAPDWPRLDWTAPTELSFEPPDHERFPCLGLAIEAARRGGTTPAVLNAADEEAVGALLRGRLRFHELPVLLQEVMEAHRETPAATVAVLRVADAWARAQVAERLGVAVPGGHVASL